jgi:hypothetical protein
VGRTSQADAVAQQKVHEALADSSIDLDLIQKMVERIRERRGRRDRATVAPLRDCGTRAKDYHAGGRLLGEREAVIWSMANKFDQAELERLLAAVDRHRGALAF